MLKISDVGQISLGVKGENEAREIGIDMSEWEEELSGGTVTVWHRRHGDTEAAQVTSASYDSESGILTWTPTSTDTYYEGNGRAEIRMVKGDVIRKSRNIITKVLPSVT